MRVVRLHAHLLQRSIFYYSSLFYSVDLGSIWTRLRVRIWEGIVQKPHE